MQTNLKSTSGKRRVVLLVSRAQWSTPDKVVSDLIHLSPFTIFSRAYAFIRRYGKVNRAKAGGRDYTGL